MLEIQRAYKDKPSYIVVLDDMKEDGNVFTEYYQKYKIASGEQVAATDWQKVNEEFYRKTENFLGMTIWGKDATGKPITSPAPPSYSYVGNPEYGQWKNDSSGSSFWEFYGKYAMLSNVLGFAGNLIYRNNYNGYRQSQMMGRPFYGVNNQYGTQGRFTQRSKPSFFQRRQARKASSSFTRSTGRNRTSSYRTRSFGGFGK